MTKLLLVGTNSVHVLNYLNLIRDHFSEVFVVTDGDGEKYETPFQLIDFSLKNPFSALQSIHKIKEIFQRFQPDLVHVHQAGTHAWLTLRALKGTSVPVIVSAWGSDILHNPNRGFLYRWMVVNILRNSTCLTSDSLHMAAEMNRLAGRQLDVTMANFGIAFDGKIPCLKENIIYSNRLHKSFYRIDKIILAFQKFQKNFPGDNWRLVIAGTGEETARLKELVNSLGLDRYIDFVGWVDAKVNAEFFSRARLFVSIPESDATSISLLEAIAAGCIPVVANLPANLEWVIDNVNGVVVTNVDDNFLEKALLVDYGHLTEINRYLTAMKTTRTVNKQKFVALYSRVGHG